MLPSLLPELEQPNLGLCAQDVQFCSVARSGRRVALPGVQAPVAERQRERVLTLEEIRAFWNGLDHPARHDLRRTAASLMTGITATFRRADDRVLHVRKTTKAEPNQKLIYQALALDPSPGGVKKMIV
ncbi:MAG: hypothetical protein HQM06_08130 [Magnetococcales bacterium]|nr:hypothetical protein [Magnetococcales bacterium]